jgi:hypothetical protein
MPNSGKPEFGGGRAIADGLSSAVLPSSRREEYLGLSEILTRLQVQPIRREPDCPQPCIDRTDGQRENFG